MLRLEALECFDRPQNRLHRSYSALYENGDQVNYPAVTKNAPPGAFCRSCFDFSAGYRALAARYSAATLPGVTCHPHTRRRRRRAFDFPRYRTVTPLRRPEHHPAPCRNRHTAKSPPRRGSAAPHPQTQERIGTGKTAKAAHKPARSRNPAAKEKTLRTGPATRVPA